MARIHLHADGRPLAAGQNVTETVQYYKISDGEGHTDAGVLTLNITGTDAHLA